MNQDFGKGHVETIEVWIKCPNFISNSYCFTNWETVHIDSEKDKTH